MLYREIIAVCSEIHTKHINTLCGQNVELLNVKPGGTYSNRWALQGYHHSVLVISGTNLFISYSRSIKHNILLTCRLQRLKRTPTLTEPRLKSNCRHIGTRTVCLSDIQALLAKIMKASVNSPDKCMLITRSPDLDKLIWHCAPRLLSCLKRASVFTTLLARTACVCVLPFNSETQRSILKQLGTKIMRNIRRLAEASSPVACPRLDSSKQVTKYRNNFIIHGDHDNV
jgi:hypothetical protein